MVSTVHSDSTSSLDFRHSSFPLARSCSKLSNLHGFKSFADKTRFEFPAGITVVVGPNGSGKSNIVDAIKWVLGEQSAKSLRGKEMADVIFKGSGTSGRKPMNTAEATLVFDNADQRLPDRRPRGPHHPPRLSQRRRRVSDQPPARPAEGHPRPVPRHRRRRRCLQPDRAGQGRSAAAGLGQGPPGDLRGGRRHQPLQGQEGRGPAAAGARRAEPAAAVGHRRGGRKPAEDRRGPGRQGPPLSRIQRAAAAAAHADRPASIGGGSASSSPASRASWPRSSSKSQSADAEAQRLEAQPARAGNGALAAGEELRNCENQLAFARQQIAAAAGDDRPRAVARASSWTKRPSCTARTCWR